MRQGRAWTTERHVNDGRHDDSPTIRASVGAFSTPFCRLSTTAPAATWGNRALPAMQELALATRQSNHLVIHFARRLLVVAQVDSPEPMGFAVRLGAHFPFRPDRASSRVLSAFQPAAAQHELIEERLTNSTRAISAVAVRDELAEVRDALGRVARSHVDAFPRNRAGSLRFEGAPLSSSSCPTAVRSRAWDAPVASRDNLSSD